MEPLLEDPVAAIEPITGLVGVDAPSGTTSATAASDLHRLAELGWFDSMPIRLDDRFEDSFLHARPDLLAEILG